MNIKTNISIDMNCNINIKYYIMNIKYEILNIQICITMNIDININIIAIIVNN